MIQKIRHWNAYILLYNVVQWHTSTWSRQLWNFNLKFLYSNYNIHWPNVPSPDRYILSYQNGNKKPLKTERPNCKAISKIYTQRLTKILTSDEQHQSIDRKMLCISAKIPINFPVKIGQVYLERCEDAVMVLGVLSDPWITVVYVGRHNVLVNNLRHHHEPLGQEVRL